MSTTSAEIFCGHSKFFDRPTGAQTKKQQSTLAFTGWPTDSTENGRKRRGEIVTHIKEEQTEEEKNLKRKPEWNEQSNVDNGPGLVDGDTTPANTVKDQNASLEDSLGAGDFMRHSNRDSVNGNCMNFFIKSHRASKSSLSWGLQFLCVQ